MKTTFNPFSIVAVIALLFFSFIISSYVEEQTGKEVNPIVLTLGVVAVGAIAVNFSNIKKGKVALSVIGANIFDMNQLQIKDIVIASIRQHFGYVSDGKGGWMASSSKSVRDIPEFVDDARIVRDDLFQIQYLTPLESTFKFFNVAQLPALEFFSNFVEAVPNSTDLRIFFGLSAELATGAAAIDTPDILAFGAAGAGDEETINGILTYEINKRKELEKQPWKSMFVNDDAIKNYLRFPKPIVWEKGNGQELAFKLAKAYAAGVHKFAKFSLLGYKLTR